MYAYRDGGINACTHAHTKIHTHKHTHTHTYTYTYTYSQKERSQCMPAETAAGWVDEVAKEMTRMELLPASANTKEPSLSLHIPLHAHTLSIHTHTPTP